MNPYFSKEVCRNGHTRSTTNTTYYTRPDGRVELRCKDCKRASSERYRKANPPKYGGKGQKIRNNIENVTELVEFGASFESIVERSGYANWTSLRKTLYRAGEHELRAKLIEMKDAA